MRKFFTVLARIIASLFAILFVVATILAILLTAIGWQAFNPNLYKNALADQQIYEKIPEMAGILIVSSMQANPCAENPLVCENVSSELKACFIQAIGNDRYLILANGQEQPTDTEKQAIQPCLDQYGKLSAAAAFANQQNPLPTASPELQACVEQAVGTRTYQDLYRSIMPPSNDMLKQMEPCFEQAGENMIPTVIKNLKASDWEAIISLILPPDDLKVMTGNMIDQLFSYLNGQTESVSLSLASLKQHLTGPEGMELIKIILRAQPDCTPLQAVQLTNPDSDMGAVAYCNPPPAILELPMPIVQAQVDLAISLLPDAISIIKPATASATSTDYGPLGSDPVSATRKVRLILCLSPLLPMLLLLFVTFFGVRTPKGWLRWWGIPLFFAGLITLGLGIASAPAAAQAWTIFVVPNLPTFLTPDLTNLLHNLATYLLHSLTESIVLAAVILAALGLVAWIISYFIKGRKETPAQANPPAPAS